MQPKGFDCRGARIEPRMPFGRAVPRKPRVDPIDEELVEFIALKPVTSGVIYKEFRSLCQRAVREHLDKLLRAGRLEAEETTVDDIGRTRIWRVKGWSTKTI